MVIQNAFGQRPDTTHNFLRMDTIKIDLGTIPWEIQEGYKFRKQIKNYSTDTILVPRGITIYHDSWINPYYSKPVPLAPRKKYDIAIVVYPHRFENGGTLQKSGSFYVFGKDKNGQMIREEYPVTFRCTVAKKLPDTTMRSPNAFIRSEEK